MSEELKSAQARIACLEGEIAKRDETIARLEPQLNRAIQANYDLREELAACRVAVENCEVFRARIMGLESQYQRDVWGLNNEGDPIGGDPAGGYANDNARLRTELAAIKAQEPIEYQLRALIRDVTNIPEAGYYMPQSWHDQVIALSLSGKLDAPVSEAKAQGVVMPEHETSTPSSKWASAGESDPHGKAYDCERAELSMGEYTDDELANAVFMHDHRSFDIAATMRGEPGSIVLLTAAKDRIRWLSRSLDKANARLNATPVQQVSVPDGWKLVPVEPTLDMGWAYVDAANDASPGKRNSFNHFGYRAMLYAAPAAPAAPAADAGLVEALDYQVLFDAIAAATSVYANGAINISVQAFRESLAAHRAKGVV